MYKILTDHYIEKFASMKTIVNAIERCFEEKANGTLSALPRFRVESEQGDLVFTAWHLDKIDTTTVCRAVTTPYT